MASRSSVAANTAKARKMAGKEAAWDRLWDSVMINKYCKEPCGEVGGKMWKLTLDEELFLRDARKHGIIL